MSLLLSACAKVQTVYDSYVNELRTINSSSNVVYEVGISYDFLYENMLVYEIVIDEPSVPMYDIRVLAIHDKETNDIYPSLGLFDETVNMVPGVVNEENGYTKGIVLIGYIPYSGSLEEFDIEVKIELSYKNETGETIKTYYVTKI